MLKKYFYSGLATLATLALLSIFLPVDGRFDGEKHFSPNRQFYFKNKSTPLSELTGAAHGSIVIYDKDGKVIDFHYQKISNDEDVLWRNSEVLLIDNFDGKPSHIVELPYEAGFGTNK